MKKILLLTVVLPLAACAGRFPNPVDVEQAADNGLTCVMIDAEIAGNRDRVQYLVYEDDDAQAYNFAVAAASYALFPPGMLALNLSDAERIEIKALEERNERLATLRLTRGCHTQELAPAEQAAYTRRRETVTDVDGRRMTLPVNRYVYGG